MHLLLLAGGFGTRLKSVAGDVPKALAPVCNLPFLHFQIENWLKQGVTRFTFLLHHQSDQIISFLKVQNYASHNECQIDWIIECQPLDTGGAIANAVKQMKLNSGFLVTNADTWLSTGMCELMSIPSPAMGVIELLDVARFGQVKFDRHFLINEFIEKNSISSKGWINAGICHLSADLFKKWDEQPFSLEKTLFPALANKGTIKAVPLKADFIDIGIPKDYFRFCKWIESGRKGTLCS